MALEVRINNLADLPLINPDGSDDGKSVVVEDGKYALVEEKEPLILYANNDDWGLYKDSEFTQLVGADLFKYFINGCKIKFANGYYLPFELYTLSEYVTILVVEDGDLNTQALYAWGVS